MDEIKVGLYTIRVSNADKVLFPDDGITKEDLIRYYMSIAKTMLPHVVDHPMMMERYPDGLSGEGFFQKEVPEYFPSWVARAVIGLGENKRSIEVICDNEATLVYLAEQDCVTPHIWLSRVDRLDYPDKMVFDLDPSTGSGCTSDDDFGRVRLVAASLRQILEDELGLTAFVMTTGSRGLHVAVPLDRGMDFDAVRPFARDIADVLTSRLPDDATTEQRKADRGAKVYVDVLRNSYGQTSVAPYAVRALPGAPVAAPLNWNEVSDPNLTPQRYNLCNMTQTLDERGDQWADFWDHVCSLDEAEGHLEGLVKRSEGQKV